jgi:hypothetical protein
VLHAVAADQHEAATCIDGCRIQHLQPRIAVASPADERRRSIATAQHPQDAEQEEKPDADTEDRDYHPAAIGAHQFFGHMLILLMPIVTFEKTTIFASIKGCCDAVLMENITSERKDRAQVFTVPGFLAQRSFLRRRQLAKKES